MTLVPDKSQFEVVDGPPAKVEPATLVEDSPPSTVVTSAARNADGIVIVRGVSADNGEVAKVIVDGQRADSTGTNYSQWEVKLPAAHATIRAHAVDVAGNIELRPHEVTVGN